MTDDEHIWVIRPTRAPIWQNAYCVTCKNELTIGFFEEQDRPGPILELCPWCEERRRSSR